MKDQYPGIMMRMYQICIIAASERSVFISLQYIKYLSILMAEEQNINQLIFQYQSDYQVTLDTISQPEDQIVLNQNFENIQQLRELESEGFDSEEHHCEQMISLKEQLALTKKHHKEQLQLANRQSEEKSDLSKKNHNEALRKLKRKLKDSQEQVQDLKKQLSMKKESQNQNEELLLRRGASNLIGENSFGGGHYLPPSKNIACNILMNRIRWLNLQKRP